MKDIQSYAGSLWQCVKIMKDSKIIEQFVMPDDGVWYREERIAFYYMEVEVLYI